ncbi:MAG: G5 domain-containing protein [Clostridiales bacterium]|nr:G5 domain-containing protein [Clostridiales bacterium]
MKKSLSIAVFVASLIIFVSMNVPVLADTSKTVFFIEDGISNPYVTQSELVRDFLIEHNIVLTTKDTLNVSYTDILEIGTKIELNRGFYISVEVDGVTDRYKIRAGTQVGFFLAEYEEENKKDYYFTGDLSSYLKPGDYITLTEYSYEDIIEEVDISFETETRESADMLQGEETVEQEGANGQRVIKTKIKYLHGEEVSREVVSNEIKAPAINKIVIMGTAQPSPTPTPSPRTTVEKKSGIHAIEIRPDGLPEPGEEGFTYKNVLTMTATAYSPGDGFTPSHGRTASGRYVEPGIVAVDPNVIPLGTRLYVVGYGYALAADTGGAIKGNKIDLYIASIAECLQFGRRTVTVYVLD